ncbi:pathogenesis-related thaumatin-like protein 3.5 [Cryptomeria japonica]|uniref:pathogenesis-related thaumatin-like protein 3.5 n=1 Tax=Cryptomeria japonica TaxID=3369 RepID=UPI0027DA3BC1|nr:pathogenesis-related thaumatin-like protein 3.5 [Cryptomeria japonica]
MASLCAAASSTKIATVENKCSFTVWPGIASYDKKLFPEPAEFKPVLNSGESYSIPFAAEWAGIIWGRTGCSFDSSELGSCLSGDCAGYLRCQKANWTQVNLERGYDLPISTPITEVELGSGTSAVNLERGYNLPISIKSSGWQGCSAHVADDCPTYLQAKVTNEVVACKGECSSYNKQCSPPDFDIGFRKRCPNVVPFQDYLRSSPDTNVTITFCPPQ